MSPDHDGGRFVGVRGLPGGRASHQALLPGAGLGRGRIHDGGGAVQSERTRFAAVIALVVLLQEHDRRDRLLSDHCILFLVEALPGLLL